MRNSCPSNKISWNVRITKSWRPVVADVEVMLLQPGDWHITREYTLGVKSQQIWAVNGGGGGGNL